MLLAELWNKQHETQTMRDRSAQSDVSLDYLFIAFKWNVTADHVIQQDTEGPDSGRHGEVTALFDPLRRTVHSRTCNHQIHSIHSFICFYYTITNYNLNNTQDNLNSTDSSMQALIKIIIIIIIIVIVMIVIFRSL